MTITSKYTNVALPEEVITEIDKVIKESRLGYTSRGEIVKEAVRNFLKELAECQEPPVIDGWHAGLRLASHPV